MFKYPERKTYRYTIPTKKGNLILRFKQATAQESYDYYEMVDRLYDVDTLVCFEAMQEMSKYFTDFIINASGLKRYQHEKRRAIELMIDDIDEYIPALASMLHKVWVSIYNGMDLPKVDGKKPRPALFENVTETIFKKTGIPTDEVYDVLTLEQVGWYVDKSIFESYETFEEGQKINDKLTRPKGGLSDEDLADLAIIKAQNATGN